MDCNSAIAYSSSSTPEMIKSRGAADILFKAVNFTYESRLDYAVLLQLNVHIPAGETVALLVLVKVFA